MCQVTDGITDSKQADSPQLHAAAVLRACGTHRLPRIAENWQKISQIVRTFPLKPTHNQHRATLDVMVKKGKGKQPQAVRPEHLLDDEPEEQPEVSAVPSHTHTSMRLRDCFSN